MTTHKHSRLTAVRTRVELVWAELDYANRRMFEIRTGAHFIKGPEKPRGRATHSAARIS